MKISESWLDGRHDSPPTEDRPAFRRQWVILKDEDEFHLDWPSLRVGTRAMLYYHPELDATHLRGPLHGYSQIVILGIAFFSDQFDTDLVEMVRDRLDHHGGDLSKLVVELVGTYVVIGCRGCDTELFTDPAGMRGVYYKKGRSASTPLLLPDVQRDRDLDRSFPFGKPDEWYPGDLCPYVGVKALMANHVLRLEEGTVTRFWPMEVPSSIPIDEALENIGRIMKNSLRTALSRWSIICSLTGGKDSRVNLAVARDFIDVIPFFTLRSERTNACDTAIPSQLVSLLGLHHSFIDVTDPDPELLKHYDEMTASMAIGERRMIINACRQLGGRRVVHLNGNLGAIAKSYFWHSNSPSSIRASSLSKEFFHRPHQVKDAMDRWFLSLPALPAPVLYNLMYLEQRGGRWMSIGETGSQLFYDSLTLFNDRQVFMTLGGAPVSWTYGGHFFEEFVRRMWPEAAAVPYCRSRRQWSKKIPMSIRQPMRKAAVFLTGSRK